MLCQNTVMDGVNIANASGKIIALNILVYTCQQGCIKYRPAFHSASELLPHPCLYQIPSTVQYVLGIE